MRRSTTRSGLAFYEKGAGAALPGFGQRQRLAEEVGQSRSAAAAAASVQVSGADTRICSSWRSA